MIWDILLILLICFASLLVILVSLILFPVVTFGVSAVYRSSQKKILLHGSWLHPRVVSFSFDLLNKRKGVTLLGFQLFRKKAADRKKESDVPVQTGTAGDTAGTAMPSGEKGEAEIVVSSKPPQEAATSEYRPKQEPGGEGKVEFEIKQEEVDAEVKPEVEVNKAEEAFEIMPEAEVETKPQVEAEVVMKPEEEFKPQDEIMAEKRTAVSEKKNKKKEKKKVKEKRAEKSGHEPKIGFLENMKRNRYIYMLRQDKMIQKLFRWLMRVLKNLLKIIRFHHFNAAVKAGIEEPALLGKIYSVYTMARSTAIVTRGKPALSFEPVFMKNCFEGETAFALKTSVLMLLWPGIVALTTFPYITVLWLFWKSRKLKQRK